LRQPGRTRGIANVIVSHIGTGIQLRLMCHVGAATVALGSYVGRRYNGTGWNRYANYLIASLFGRFASAPAAALRIMYKAPDLSCCSRPRSLLLNPTPITSQLFPSGMWQASRRSVMGAAASHAARAIDTRCRRHVRCTHTVFGHFRHVHPRRIWDRSSRSMLTQADGRWMTRALRRSMYGLARRMALPVRF